MPHKRNPEKCERISGLARLFRGYTISAFENVALWHERDISHSSVERVILPDACILLDYMLDLFTFIVRGMQVAQMRLAPYSYDWIDNLCRRSPRELAGLPEPQVGERFTTAGGRELGRIVSVDRGKQLTGTIMGAFMSYVLVPQVHDTRLLLKVVMQTTRWALGLSVGDLIMARRQLLNLKQLAERHHHQGTAKD